MKKVIFGVLALSFLLGTFSLAHAEYVSGYYRKNGTYVQGYQRTAPDGDPYNNYDYPGNYNPNTGENTPGNPETYLNDYYSTPSSSTSDDSSEDDYSATPTCSAEAYYNYSTDSCQCNSGYIVKDGSCVDADSYCEDQIGFESSYDSVDNSCKCDEGYVLNSSQTECISQDDFCQDQYGVNSNYDDLSGRCACDDGYSYQDGQCEEVPDTGPSLGSDTLPNIIVPASTTPEPSVPSYTPPPAKSASPTPSLKDIFSNNNPDFFTASVTPELPVTHSAPTPLPTTIIPAQHHWYTRIVNFVRKIF